MIAQLTQEQCYTFDHESIGYCAEMYFYRESLNRMFKDIQRRKAEEDIKPEKQFNNMKVTYKQGYTVYSIMDEQENYLIQFFHRKLDNSVLVLSDSEPINIYL